MLCVKIPLLLNRAQVDEIRCSAKAPKHAKKSVDINDGTCVDVEVSIPQWGHSSGLQCYLIVRRFRILEISVIKKEQDW